MYYRCRSALVFLTFTLSSVLGYAQRNPIQDENAKSGNADWALTKPATGGEIEGYADLTSVTRGQSIQFFVSANNDQTFTIDIYRTGYYNGDGARLVLEDSASVGFQATPSPDID